jgi:heat-inducible transcriptional repressor
VEVDTPFTQEDLTSVLQALNDLLPGKSADTINLPLMVELEARVGRLSPVVGQIVKLVYDTMLEQSGSDLRVEGVNRLLQYHEYEDIDELRKMMTLFEEKQDLLSAISDGTRESDDGVQVFIGSENSVKVMNNSTLIYRPVKRGDKVIGAIGVVGPRRMDYAKVISIIDHLTRGIDSLLSGDTASLDAPKE